MFKQFFTKGTAFQSHLLSAAVVAACLILLALTAVRQSKPDRDRSLSTDGSGSPPATGVKTEGDSTNDLTPKFQGAAALEYLAKTEDGRSLTKAVTAARFGLKWQEPSPFGGSEGGYLGMSHVQNLNAWFDDESVTIRPTLSEGEREKAWRLGMKLKAYGYGAQLSDPPPITSHKVKDNRIEYERSDCQMPIADCRFDGIATFQSLSNVARPTHEIEKLWTIQSAIGNRQLAMTEWYENRAAGIEQGFTLDAPPERAGVGEGEPLRLVVALEGDLRARAKGNGSEVELFREGGEAVLSYGQLVAKDASGRQLGARMETEAGGSEIALVVDDRGASYPIEIDPITATLESKLTAPSPRTGDEFGNAVAIDGATAVVGSFLDDFNVTDDGEVYIYTRNSSSWSNTIGFTGGSLVPKEHCGLSVAISGNKAVFGCPGFDNNTGRAIVVDLASLGRREITPTGLASSAEYGSAVAISPDGSGLFEVIVGAPADSSAGLTNTGAAYVLTLDSNLNVTKQQKIDSIS